MKSLAILLLVTLFSLNCYAEDPLIVGWIGPLTGNSAVVGIDSMRGMELAVTEHGKKKIKLIIEDDGYETKRAVTAYEKLVHRDGAKVIFIQTYGAVFALAPRALRDGVLLIDPLDCNDDLAALPESVLCLATQTESISQGFASDIIKRNFSKVLFLCEANDPWMPYVMKVTIETLRKNGITSIVEESILAQDTDYRAVLTKSVERGDEAIVVLGNDQMGRAFRQARDLGSNAQFYGVGSILSPGFQALAGSALEGAMSSGWSAPRGKQFETFSLHMSSATTQRRFWNWRSCPLTMARRLRFSV